jgi:UDP-GlcNAc:undecaprenyl-phosphate/decaprenyl-phosphate GlcNAc-1-phosphate transferase
MIDEILHYINQLPFLTVLISFSIGFGFMPMVLNIAKKRGFVVKPNKRTSHEGAVPNIGGINIFISYLLTVFFLSYNLFSEVQYMIIGVFIILIVGFVDDLIDIKAHWKLIGEISAAFFLIVLSDIRLTNLHGFLGVYQISDISSYALSFFVFIVIINSLNLIDGIDGLASGLGIIYTLFFAVYFQLAGFTNFSISSYALVGSLAVFFMYNVFGHKNKIFMGDSGALLLGYMISLYIFQFCEMNAYHHVPEFLHMKSAPSVIVCIMAVPLFDTFRIILTRLKKGVSPFKADKNHIHHLLLKIGLKHVQVTLVLLFVTIVFVILGLIGRNWSIYLLTLVAFTLASVLTYILWRIVDYKTIGKGSPGYSQKK